MVRQNEIERLKAENERLQAQLSGKTGQLQSDLTAALARERELMREICKLTWRGMPGRVESGMKAIAKERDWPSDLFEGEEDE